MRLSFSQVRAKGIEPIRLSAPDPKSGLSTNFNTPADFMSPSVSKRTANVRQNIRFAKLFDTVCAVYPIMCLLFGKNDISFAASAHII